MKIKFGKLLNSLRSCKWLRLPSFGFSCCLLNMRSSTSSDNAGLSLPTTATSPATSAASTPRLSLWSRCANEARLCYYTFFFNESFDTLTCLETAFAPFAASFNKCFRCLAIVGAGAFFFLLRFLSLSVNISIYVSFDDSFW